jgi:hypothetical protein
VLTAPNRPYRLLGVAMWWMFYLERFQLCSAGSFEIQNFIFSSTIPSIDEFHGDAFCITTISDDTSAKL